MHNYYATKRDVLLVSKTCVQRVSSMVLSPTTQTNLWTASHDTLSNTWINTLSYPLVLHKFVVQLYPRITSTLTEVIGKLYSLSTPLIIRSTWLTKENLLVRNGG
jgi:hypothetical protein